MRLFFVFLLFVAQHSLASTVFQMEEIFSIPQDESQPYVFGIVEDVQIDGNGDLYLLDTQLNNIKVFSKTGQYLRTIGRGGPGPGELSAPGSLVLCGDQSIGIVSKRFGRITIINKYSGDPLGSFMVGGQEKPNTTLGKVKWLDSHFVAVITEAVGSDFLHWRRYLGVFPYPENNSRVFPETILCDVGWNTGSAREENEHYGLWDPWAVSSIGTITLARYWGSPELVSYDLSGNVISSFASPHKPYPRTQREKCRFVDLLCGGISPEEIGVELILEDNEAAVKRVFHKENGDILVQTSGCKVEGEFLRLYQYCPQDHTMDVISILGSSDPFFDQFYFGPNNVLFVIHGGEHFIHNHRGRDPGPNEYDLNFVCYRMVSE